MSNFFLYVVVIDLKKRQKKMKNIQHDVNFVEEEKKNSIKLVEVNI